MRLILDANQASRIPHGGTVPELVLPTYVLAEILLGPDPTPILERLSTLNPRLGLEPAAAFDAIATLTKTGIHEFEPFAPSKFVYSAATLDSARCIAREKKKQHREFCSSMFEKAKAFRKKLVNGPPVKFHAISEALSGLTSFQEMVVDWIRNGGKRKCVVSDQNDLYHAVMQSRYFANFFRTILYFLISFSRAWKDQCHNFDPSGRRDDWTDITLPLYSRNGDFILTDDTKLRNAVRMIEPSGTLLAGTFAQLVPPPNTAQ
jgi:hypothetical protein